MSGPRVYLDLPLASGSELLLPAAAAGHVVRVLRLRRGAPLTLFNGRGGSYAATLLDAGRHEQARVAVGAHDPRERESPLPATLERDGKQVWARVGAFTADERESPLDVTLLQGIARGERMDLIVQKATELGVARIVPLLCERSVVRLDHRQAERRLAHWRAIAIAACEQCGRNRLPRIESATAFAALADAADSLLSGGGAARLLLTADAPVALAAMATRLEAVNLLIGPEGGLSEPEQALARRVGFQPCHLGPRILRTETAPPAALAVLQALAGDLR
jgi:16S rRNA (uracil1498-N3)-methyltransferase